MNLVIYHTLCTSMTTVMDKSQPSDLGGHWTSKGQQALSRTETMTFKGEPMLPVESFNIWNPAMAGSTL